MEGKVTSTVILRTPLPPILLHVEIYDEENVGRTKGERKTRENEGEKKKDNNNLVAAKWTFITVYWAISGEITFLCVLCGR